MMNPRPYSFLSNVRYEKLMEELTPTKQDLSKDVVSRMSHLERKKLKDHKQDRNKIEAKRNKLRSKRKSKRK